MRSSVRWFKQDPIPREVLENVLEVSIRAPQIPVGNSGFHLVENSAERLRFHELLRNAHEVYARIVLKRRPSEQSVSK
ncbi:MAG: nitroreductase family protein [Thermosphaera sp.]